MGSPGRTRREPIAYGGYVRKANGGTVERVEDVSVRGVTGTRVKPVDAGSRMALGVLLFFPLLYYPLSTLLIQVAPGVSGVSNEAMASGAALITVVFLVLNVLLSRRSLLESLTASQILRTPETWGFTFLGWIAVISMFQWEATTVQNLIVYAVFYSAILLAQFTHDALTGALRAFVWIFTPILIVIGFVAAFADLMRSEIGWQLGGPGLYASYGVIAVVGLFAIPIATWVRALLGGALFAGAVISSSRTSMTTLLVVLLVGLIVTAPHAWRRSAWLVPTALIAFIAVLQLPWIRLHMQVSAITTPGFPIDDSGRGMVWIPTIESWLTQPVLGHGAGSSQTVSEQSEFPLNHPHSEYLRILHDAGLIGFILFGAFVVLAMLWLWPRAGGKPRHELVVAGFLIIVAGLVLGTIENYLVFPSLMWPSAVFLGLGLAAARRDGQSFWDLRRRNFGDIDSVSR